MKVTYISHSGFLIEMEKVNLLFDYFKGEIPKMDKEKPLYVFVSHSHHDHFNPLIFELEKQYDTVTYIMSGDVVCDRALKRCHKMGAYEKKQIDDLTIRTLKSTDLGVAFCIQVEKKTLYHAGDLHWWHWIGEPDEDNLYMEKAYKHELELLRDTHIDVAFLVLDMRQEQAYDLGINEFLSTVDVDVVFPMHCWDEYSLIQTYKHSQKGEAYKGRIVDITKEGETFFC